jgi:hypothetical protein
VPREKQQPIGLKAYLQFTLPFDIAGFLTGAWIARSPEALTSFYEMLRSKNIIKIVPPASGAEFRESWWIWVAVCTVIGMVLGEGIRPFFRKGPIY